MSRRYQMSNSKEPTVKRISKIRTKLNKIPVLKEALEYVCFIKDDVVDRMAISDRVIFYNSNWIKTITDDQLQGVMVHEVLHYAMFEEYRFDKMIQYDCINFDDERWRNAKEYHINAIVTNMGFELPPSHLFSEDFCHLVAEQIYEHMPETRRTEIKCEPPGDAGVAINQTLAAPRHPNYEKHR